MKKSEFSYSDFDIVHNELRSNSFTAHEMSKSIIKNTHRIVLKSTIAFEKNPFFTSWNNSVLLGTNSNNKNVHFMHSCGN